MQLGSVGQILLRPAFPKAKPSNRFPKLQSIKIRHAARIYMQ
jgi:hypothetical protein